MTTPLPPADDLQPEEPTFSAPLNAGDWAASPPSFPATGKWNSSEIILGFTTVAVLASLFMPWFTVTGIGSGVGASISGTGAHGYLWLVFALDLVVLCVLVVPDLIARAPARLPSNHQLVVGASGLNFLLVLLGFLARPTATAAGALFTSTGASVGVTYGAFIALVAVILAFLAAVGTGGAGARSSGVRARS